ncbi:MAG: UDP-N-acetylmuramate dehydrogenase [Actinobacteria bacterium]|nr:UDP-N-acetylmuramate dehydrogenase [Actinomycetota bacterium]
MTCLEAFNFIKIEYFFIYNKMDLRLKKLIEEAGLLETAVFNCSLSALSAIKSGGFCSCFLTVNKRNQLIDFLNGFNSLKNIDFKLLVVGHATNILFNDGCLNIILLRLGDDFDYIDIKEDGTIIAGAATGLQKFIVETAKECYDFSSFAGIPGTLGGAVAGNSGSARFGINSLVRRIKYTAFCQDKACQHEKELATADYSYRKLDSDGIFIITDVIFDGSSLLDKNSSKNLQGIKPGQKHACIARKEVFNKIRENIKMKKQSQPLNTKNAGCFFKNPAESAIAAGKLIDGCGLKGFSYGGAQISKLHANFIINACNASSKDIYTLSAVAKDIVMQKYGIALEYEVRLAGFKNI